jgi:DNA ligase D-like protein (predicted 3'-phosphoesterase)
MPKYVILEHDCSKGLHYDFMLEAGDVLKTWALSESPSPGVEIAAVALTDHRPAYLDYEGPVSGNRGTVVRWDGGEYEEEKRTDAELVVRLHGEKLSGLASLTKLSATGDRWKFFYTDSLR